MQAKSATASCRKHIRTKGLNQSPSYQAARNQRAPFFQRLLHYNMLYFVHRLNTDTLLENCFDKYIV